MTDKETNNQSDLENKERRKIERRSQDLPNDTVNKRVSQDRRVKDEKIDFDNQRKKQRRKPVVGVDIEERRKNDRRKPK